MRKLETKSDTKFYRCLHTRCFIRRNDALEMYKVGRLSRLVTKCDRRASARRVLTRRANAGEWPR